MYKSRSSASQVKVAVYAATSSSQQNLTALQVLVAFSLISLGLFGMNWLG